MDIQLDITGGPDLETRFKVLIGGKETGELQMARDDATRFADLLFGGNYKIIKN